MKLPVCWSVVLLVAVPGFVFGQSPPYQSDFPPEEFRARWAEIFDRMGERGIAIIQGMPKPSGFVFPRQSNEFYYLCGIETPHAYLVLDGRDRKVTLFLPPRDEALERAEGRILSADDAEAVRNLTGVDKVASTKTMNEDWARQFFRGPRTVIYTPLAPAERAAESRGEIQAANAAIALDYWDGRPSREAHFAQLLGAPAAEGRRSRPAPILDELRSVKSPREIALIRRASQLAGRGIIEAIKSTRAGATEYQLDAVARYVFLANGARLEGYRSITASGTENIWNMHYFRNLDTLKDGDLVLMDFAPDYRYYVSDIARMWPVSGRYSPQQRELLQFLLDYRNAILARLRPGVTPAAIQKEAKTAMEDVFKRTRFSKPAYEQAARRLVETGGGVFSHPVGMAVHDDGEYSRGPLKPGHVFSIDPQLRVPDEKLYIRYEDVVVITESGYENFTDFLPGELDEIEKLVGRNGLLQAFPPLELPESGELTDVVMMDGLETTGGQFPLQEYRLREGGREWAVLHTGAVLTRDDESRVIEPQEVRLPYGVSLWPSAIALAHDIAGRADFRGRSVLELGAGTGLPGIVAASLRASVVQTDRDELALLLCRRNGERNGIRAEYRIADWTAWDDPERYDWIIGSDVLYGESLHPHLRRIFEASLAAGGRVLLADPHRSVSLKLLEAMEADGWAVGYSRWTVGETGARPVAVYELAPG